MPRYLITWKANASVWPADPKATLAILEGAIAGGDQLLAAGAIKEMGWFSGEEGFAIFEADSKDAVVGMLVPFFPYYSQDVREIAAWESSKQAMLASARQAASR